MTGTGNPIGDVAVGISKELLSQDNDQSPREQLARTGDSAALLRGDKSAGVATTTEGLIESIEDITKLLVQAAPKQKAELLAKLNSLVGVAAERNVTLRELKGKGQLDIFQRREEGYQGAQYTAQQHWYTEQLAIRKSATAGITGMTSLKGTIAMIAFMVNDLMGGALGEMPLMKQWKAEAEAFKVNMDDIRRPARVDLNFKEQPNAQISEKELLQRVNGVVIPALRSQAQTEAENLARSVVPTRDNPSPVLPKALDERREHKGAASRRMLEDSREDVTAQPRKESTHEAPQRKPGERAAKMFKDPALEPA